MGAEVVSAQQLAEASGESYDAVDHWAEKGLLVLTRKGRRRSFALEQSLQRIRRIRELQNKGHSLDGIKDNLLSGR